MAELPTVTVSASAEREVPPDSFSVRATVSVEGRTPAEATTDLLARYATLEAAVADLPGSVTVTHGRIGTWHQTEKRGSRSHAHRTMSLDGTDLDLVAAVADAVTSVDDVGIEGPEWSVDRNNPAHDEIQTETVREARARAGRYAAAAGGTLGRLVQIRDPESSRGRPMFASAKAGRSPRLEPGRPEFETVDLSPQPIRISATVEATWYVELP